jgi:hypothetical protein
MTLAVISIFVAYVLHQEINIGYRLRMLFKLSRTKPYKLLDCYPCFAFWTALAITQDLILTMTCYMIAVVIDKLND